MQEKQPAPAKEQSAICPICPHHCQLTAGQTGLCTARANVDGSIICTNYGQLTSLALDPIEKKPLYHFHPGNVILSAGSYGCNIHCPFCQNYEISQAQEGTRLTHPCTPMELTELAADARTRYGNIGVAFTYNESLVSYEYVRDCAELLHAKNLAVVLVTNGQICAKPLAKLLPHIDAMNIDLKGFTQTFYDWLGGDLRTTQNTIQNAIAAGVHVEVTTLIIPGKNDSDADMDAEARWLAALSPAIPLHLSRYFPRYHCTLPATPTAMLKRLQQIAARHLQYVHLGNV